MTLEQLRIFVTVAEREHMTRAAEVLHLTQSAVSVAIAGLEQHYRLKLFDRVGRGIMLTEAGRMLLTEAKATLARAASTEQAMADYAGLRHGKLTIHASQTIASYFLPPLLVRFQALYPGIELLLMVGNTAQVARAVKDGVAEIGFVEGPLDEAMLTVDAVAADQMVIVVSPHHPWASGAALTRADLARTGWVFREEGSGTREAFVARLNGMALPVALTLPTNEAVCAAVEAGAGAAALSHLVCSRSLAAGALALVNFPLPARMFFAVRHKERYQAKGAAALLALARAA
jgi:DNA-binding transcriptional LysR family regulator